MRNPSDLPPRRIRRRRPPGYRGRLAIIAAVGTLLVLFLSARGISRFFTDLLWFRSLGFGSVFTTILRTKIVLGVLFTVLATVGVVVNLTAADRLAPRITDLGPSEQVIMRYRDLMMHSGRKVRLLVGLAFGFLAGAPAAANWREWQMFRNGTRFGTVDPIFNKDAGFYVFQLPFISFLLDWLFAAAVICLLVTVAVHYMNGGIRLQLVGRRVASHVKLHISLLLSVLAVLKAAGYWFDRYRLYGSTRGVVDGPGFADIHATLPAITLLMWISLLAVVLLLVNVRQRGWRLPVIAVGLWSLVAFVAGQVYPAAVQRFQVRPAESKREQVTLARNIEATRVAMGLDAVTERPFKAEAPTADAVKASPNVASARLLDQGSAYDAFKNLQALTGFYRFGNGVSGGLDVDRYTRDGVTQSVMVGVRELNPKGVSATWENTHLAYTHGSGLVTAAANTVAADGRPVFVDEQLTGKAIKTGIYVGENMASYAVVRTGRNEIDAPVGTSGTVVSTSYDGQGGVILDSRLRRAAFALRFAEWNLFGSSLITDESRIIYNRDVVERLQTIAPFLQLDSDPYAAMVNGRITWIVDAYTTTSSYPYAQRADTSDLPGESGLRGLTFNYVRNSVKATVDAYDGTVKLFVVDPSDPMVQTYQKIFPSLFHPKSEASQALQEHFRYPSDLFTLQTATWGRYRIDDTENFYQRSNAWDVAQAPATSQPKGDVTAPVTTVATGLGVVPQTVNKQKRVEPYYTLLQTPGAERQEFVMLRTFVPYSRGEEDRQQLTAFMTASSDPATYGKLRVFTVNDPLPNGPFLVSNDASQQFSSELSLLDQAGSQVRFGDLQLVPVGDQLLWIRPWFLLATGSTTVPKLDSVTVTVGKRTYRGETLDIAVQRALGADAGVGSTGSQPSTPTPTPGASSGSVEELLADAVRLKSEADAALRKSPPSFDEYSAKLTQAFEKASQAARLATGKGVTPPAPAATTPSTTANA